MITTEAMKLVNAMQGGAYSPGAKEVKSWVIWDTRYFDSTISDATFFSVPVGGGWRGNTIKSMNETNLEDSGRLAAEQRMVFTHFAPMLVVPQLYSATDTAALARSFTNLLASSTFELAIRNKAFEIQVHGSEFLPRPIFLPGLQDNDADANDVFQVGRCVSFGWLNLDPVPIPVGDQQGFSVKHEITNPDTSVKAILDADAAALNTANATMQILVKGVTMHGK